MNVEQAGERHALHARCKRLIERLSDGSRDDAARDALLVDLAAYQARWVSPYAHFAEQRAAANGSNVERLAALPTDGFRHARISSRSESDELRLFRSSGTTDSSRSLHSFSDLSLYDLAAQAAGRYALFPDAEQMEMLIIAPHESELPDSSLSYMLSRFVHWFGNRRSTFLWPIDETQCTALVARLRNAERAGYPVALLGTSFGFVHLLDALGAERFALPEHSRIMQTGGFKGRSREVSPEAMRALLSTTFGIPEPWIIAEYGMTELSSQLYETTLREAALGLPTRPRRLWWPGWVRASVIDPETQLPRTDAERGLIRIDDAANLDSVACVQTADVGRRERDGIVVLGRAQGAEARGCSITADELLGKRS